MSVILFSDYFLPSKNELNAIYVELAAHSVGSFTTGIYWSSSEDVVLSSTFAQEQDFSDGSQDNGLKTNFNCVRACRAFTSISPSYAVRDVGPAGGLIFYKSGDNYLEAAPIDQSISQTWSNITGVPVTGTNSTIGTGQLNTTLIISQAGHTDSAAKLCDDLIITVGPSVSNSSCLTSGNASTFRFYLTIGSSVVECYPLNFLETTLNDSYDGDNVFYRREFSGLLTFTNLRGDYDLIKTIHEIDPATEILLSIRRNNINYWNGQFSTSDGKWDYDRCIFEVTPLVNDGYTDILDKADDEYNIIPALVPITTRAVQGVIDQVYERNYWLIDIINYLASQIKPGVTVSSHFFTNITNYVTQNTNHLTLLTLAQKSDIIRPNSTEPSRYAMLSWNKLMDILWGIFEVQWRYNSDDTIDIEHKSWFSSSAGMDLRIQVICKATNKFSYVKEMMPKYESSHFMEAFNDNFFGLPIWYDSKIVNQDPKANKKETSISVTTDLEYIINHPEKISDEGFVMLCNYEYSPAVYRVRLELGALHPDVRLNMNLSWANLYRSYFMFGRILLEGYMNGALTTFWSALKTIKQECFAIICAADNYDPSNYITTELGETYFSGAKAKVEQSSLKPSGEIKLSLLYGPPDNVPSQITDEKWILIFEDGCGQFSAILSEGADAELTINIKHVIFETGGLVTHCADSIGQDWVIHLGETTSTFNLDLCDAIPAGGCIYYNSTTYDFINWPVSWILDNTCKCP